MKLPEKTKAAEIFEQYCDAYKRRDIAAILNMFTQDCNLWGTGLDEYRVGLKEVEDQHQRDWAQSEKGEIQIVSWVPSPSDANWAAGRCNALITINGEQHVFEHLRGTIIVKKEKGDWKICHMQASFPDYRNEQDGSFPKV